MLDIVLDTSVFRNDPKRIRADFQALERLAKTERIKLHIPYFVQREFVTHIFSEYYDPNLRVIETSILKLKKNLPPELIAKLSDLEERFFGLKDEIANFPDENFAGWANSMNAVVHPIADNHGVKVADGYFEGAPPFREKKKRDDIPDAFIWQVISDLSTTLEQLIVVVEDKGLRLACESKKNIKIFDTLAEFLASDICSPLLTEDSVEEEIAEILKLIPLLEERLKETVIDQTNDIAYGLEIESTWIPDDNNVAMFQGLEEIESLEINTEQSLYYGDGAMVVQFNMSAMALLGYAIFKADYYCLSDERAKRIGVSSLNKHYYDAEESYPLEITGNIAIDFPIETIKKKQLSEEDIEQILDDVVITVNEIQQIDIPENIWRLWE